MMDDQRPSGLFSDLATNPETKAAILIDCELAAKHGQTIRQHYAVGGYNIDFEEGYQAATRLWRYLRET
jgi:hypothetical protein